MSYKNRIRILEEQFNNIDVQIKSLERLVSVDLIKLNELKQTKQKYLDELKYLRYKQYLLDQEVDLGYDR
jgi:hypothetical protein